MSEADFASKLAVLTSAEAAAASLNPDRMGVIIERLAAALGFTIAMAAQGDRDGIDTMIAGAEAYAHQEAVHKAAFARFMALAKTDAGRRGRANGSAP
jgi:hypothetical protein